MIESRWSVLSKPTAALFIVNVTVMTVLLTGCPGLLGPGGSNKNVDPIDLSRIRTLSGLDTASLQGYTSRSDVAADLDAIAYDYAMSLIESPYFPDNVRPYRGYPELVYATDDAAGSANQSYETNTQVSDVDELDVVKSNGSVVAVAQSGEVITFAVTGADAGRIIDRVSIPEADQIHGLFWEGDHLLVLAQTGWYWDLWYGGGSSTVQTSATVVDISEGGDLGTSQTTTWEGSLIDARLTDGKAYVVTHQSIDYQPLTEGIYQAIDLDASPEARVDQAVDALSQVIPQWRETVMADLFSTVDGDIDTTTMENTMRAHSFGMENDRTVPFYRYLNGFLKVRSINVSAGPQAVSSAGAFTSGGLWGTDVYANTEYVVIGTNSYASGTDGWSQNTLLRVFEIGVGGIRPFSQGKAPGRHLNQFSMDIYDGYLRVATTEDARWSVDDTGAWSETNPSESRVTVLDLTTQELTETGSATGLGINEEIFAVRFLGHIGLVVTFEQIDPFYTLDLSDPAAPTVAGELKVPGFSRYIHPIGPDTVLAVGHDATLGGAQLGAQVAIYDISDITTPERTQVLTFPDNTWSNANWDHHAFRYVPDEVPASGTLIIPLENYYNWSTPPWFSVMSIDATAGIEEQAQLTIQRDSSYYWYGVSPRSMVFTDRIIILSGMQAAAYDRSDYSQLWTVQLGGSSSYSPGGDPGSPIGISRATRSNRPQAFP